LRIAFRVCARRAKPYTFIPKPKPSSPDQQPFFLATFSIGSFPDTFQILKFHFSILDKSVFFGSIFSPSFDNRNCRIFAGLWRTSEIFAL
jgi:hypothetical protein